MSTDIQLLPSTPKPMLRSEVHHDSLQTQRSRLIFMTTAKWRFKILVTREVHEPTTLENKAGARLLMFQYITKHTTPEKSDQNPLSLYG